MLDAIHGRDLDGEHFTLLDVRLAGYRGSPPAQLWRPQAVLRGAHVDPQPQFNRMLLRTRNLPALANHPHVDIDELRTADNWPAKVQARAERHLCMSGHVGAAMVDLVCAPTHTGGGPETTVAYEVFFDVVPDSPIGWRDFVDGPLSRLVDFARFALTIPSPVERVRLKYTESDIDGDVVWVDLELPFHSPFRLDDQSTFLPSFERLGSANDLPAGALDAWDQCVDELGPVATFLLAPGSAPFIYSEHRFTSLTQAAEGLYDRLHGAKAVPSAEHRERVDAVLACELPSAHREWVAGVLASANGVPFGQKMEHLLEAVEPIREALDTSSLSREISNTRNPLSHGVLERKGMADPERRHWIGEVIRFAVSWHLLCRLLSEEEATRRIADHATLKHALKTLADEESSKGPS